MPSTGRPTPRLSASTRRRYRPSPAKFHLPRNGVDCAAAATVSRDGENGDSNRARMGKGSSGGYRNTNRRAKALRLLGAVDSRVSRVVPRPLPRDRANPVDAGADSAAGVLLELHPARELPGHRARVPAGRIAPAPVRVVPAVLGAIVVGVYRMRLEIAVTTPGAIYFSSGTSERVMPIESTLLLPAIFLVVVALFTRSRSGWAGRWPRCRRCAATRSTSRAVSRASWRSADVLARVAAGVWFGPRGPSLPLIVRPGPGEAPPARSR